MGRLASRLLADLREVGRGSPLPVSNVRRYGPIKIDGLTPPAGLPSVGTLTGIGFLHPDFADAMPPGKFTEGRAIDHGDVDRGIPFMFGARIIGSHGLSLLLIQ